jgi:hypothetical protein
MEYQWCNSGKILISLWFLCEYTFIKLLAVYKRGNEMNYCGKTFCCIFLIFNFCICNEQHAAVTASAVTTVAMWKIIIACISMYSVGRIGFSVWSNESTNNKEEPKKINEQFEQSFEKYEKKSKQKNNNVSQSGQNNETQGKVFILDVDQHQNPQKKTNVLNIDFIEQIGQKVISEENQKEKAKIINNYDRKIVTSVRILEQNVKKEPRRNQTESQSKKEKQLVIIRNNN